MLFTDKYAPKKLDDVIGHEDAKRRVKQWMLNWMHGKPQKPVILYGPPGIGKTGMAYALAHELDLDVLELNASMLRNRQHVERLLGGATLAESLSGRKKLFLVDDVDIFQKSDRGGVAALAAFLRESRYPFMLTALNAWEKKLAPVRMLCELLQLRRVSKPALHSFLKKVAHREKLPISPEEIEHITEHSSGDVRSALNDLQLGRRSDRDREEDIFHQVRTIFKAQRYMDAREASQGNADYDLLKLWIDENIPYEYDKTADLARAFDRLSRADVFEGRIQKSRWVLLRYCFDLLTAGVALSKEKPYLKFTRYQFPTYLKQMSVTVARRALRRAVSKKIAARTHTSARDAVSYFPLLQVLAQPDPERFALFYRLEEEELAYLLETSVHKIRK
ncbi:MAG TPA: replication factor C large subunit [Candidatus Bilamarchaeaceae archaeon]|nr:replication factor C large subunit [Candidatus Bilamarchaeaceae archaeon]